MGFIPGTNSAIHHFWVVVCLHFLYFSKCSKGSELWEVMKGLRAWAPDLGSNPSSSPWLQGFYMPGAGDTSRVTEVVRPVRPGRPRPLTTVYALVTGKTQAPQTQKGLN